MIGAGLEEYGPRSSGELFLYVNDAVFGFLPDWAWPYRWEIGRNQGEGTITLSPQRGMKPNRCGKAGREPLRATTARHPQPRSREAPRTSCESKHSHSRLR